MGLEVVGELGQLVEEEGAAVGLADEAGALGAGGVGVAADVAEELGVGEALGEGGGVAGDEGAGAAGGEGVEGAGDELFAAAALALDEDVLGGLGGEQEGVAELPRGGALAEEAVRVGGAEREGGGASRSAVGGQP